MAKKKTSKKKSTPRTSTRATQSKASTTRKKAATTKTQSAGRSTSGGTGSSKSAAKASGTASRTKASGTSTQAASPKRNGQAKPTIPAPDHLVVSESRYGNFTEDQLRKVKTGLTRKDLEHFRVMLLEKRAEIVGDVEGMEHARNNHNAGGESHMPLHMADIGSDNYEQEFTLGLMESERKLLREIDEALIRIQSATYGVCLDSGQPIPKARLEIKPWAKYTIEIARERERRGLD